MSDQSLNDWPHDARILRVVNAARGFVHNATGAARNELLVAVGDLNAHSKEIGEVKRPDTLIALFKNRMVALGYTHESTGMYDAVMALEDALKHSSCEIRLLTPALKGEIADNIDPENRTATDLVQDVWDELAERGLVGATVREAVKRTLRDEFLERPDIVELWEGFKTDNELFGEGA